MYQETDAEQLRVFLPSLGFAQPCTNTPLSTQYVAAHPGCLLSSCPQEHDFFIYAAPSPAPITPRGSRARGGFSLG